jgi:hypothetical protein
MILSLYVAIKVSESFTYGVIMVQTQHEGNIYQLLLTGIMGIHKQGW